MKKLFLLWAVLILMSIIGEVKCIIKALNCNWEPIGKAEVVYTVAAMSGMGSIVGWFNIKDN